MIKKGVNELLNDLYVLRRQNKEYYQIVLRKAQIDLVEAKNKVDSYDVNAILKIEKWLTSFDDNFEGVSLANIEAANIIYSYYLYDQGEFMRLEQLVSEYTNIFKEKKEKEENKVLLIIEACYSIIDQVLNDNFKGISYDKDEVINEGEKAIREGIDTYKLNIPFSFLEYVKKIILIRFKKLFSIKYGKYVIVDDSENDIKSYECLIKKLISMLKTNMSIFDIYNFLKLNGYNYSDEYINKCINDLNGMLNILDGDVDRDIKLICNLYNISDDLAMYIYDNRESIKEPVNSFIDYNEF